VRARDIPGFVLDPQPTGITEAERGAQALTPLERGNDKSVSVNVGHLPIQLGDEMAESIVSHAGRGRSVVAVQQIAVADERVGLSVSGRKPQLCRVQGPDQHVIDVVSSGVAAAERVGI